MYIRTQIISYIQKQQHSKNAPDQQQQQQQLKERLCISQTQHVL
jgi:hypothetical protein